MARWCVYRLSFKVLNSHISIILISGYCAKITAEVRYTCSGNTKWRQADPAHVSHTPYPPIHSCGLHVSGQVGHHTWWVHNSWDSGQKSDRRLRENVVIVVAPRQVLYYNTFGMQCCFGFLINL